MDDPGRPSSAIDDYQATFGSGFDVRRLWRDRQAIVANPRIATEARPPLAFPPLRFALTLVIVPMLAIGWLTSQLAGVIYPDAHEPTPIELAARAVEAPLDDFLGNPDSGALRALAAPELAALGSDGEARVRAALEKLAIRQTEVTPDALGMGEAAATFVGQLKASSLSPAQQRQAAAEILHKTRAGRRINAVNMAMLRSFMEGGAFMQVLAALMLVVSARVFRSTVRKDERFPRGERAGALYLYYGTARLFWLSMASIATYGVMAFASASDNTALFDTSNRVNQAVGLVSLIYLLFFSRDFARALRDDDALPAGAAFAMGRKLLWSQVLAFVASMLLALVFGILFGLGMSWWHLHT